MVQMRWFICLWVMWGVLGTLGVGNQALGQEYEGQILVKASLVTESGAFEKGKWNRAGVLLEQADGWHTYWKYSGDSGMATSFEWTLPEGWQAGEIQWPVPHRLEEGSGLEVYAYKDQVLLMVDIWVPENWSATEGILKVKADWLVCEKICIPGGEELALTVQVGEEAVEGTHTALFEEFKEKLPARGPPPFEISWEVGEKQTVLNVKGVVEGASVDFYPLPDSTYVLGHPVAQLADASGQVRIPIPVDAGEIGVPMEGVLVMVAGDVQHAYAVEGAKTGEEDSADGVASNAPGAGTGIEAFAGNLDSPISWWQALIYGFIGGMILNLMPCVLPVISLKIFGFVKQAGEAPGRIFRMGVAFALGVYVWFMALAIFIIGLKMAGHEVSWAFQFQNPYFILFMCALIFVFALNMFGVYEIYLPGGASEGMVGLTQKSGYSGAFFQGVFATILATPCTAPYLGAALGFAFAQPSGFILLMFFMIATGMALPFLLLSARPEWLKFVPKPGVWMEHLKQFMGFLLIATMLWLLWILGAQGGDRGVEAIIWTSGFLLVLSIACWIKGRFTGPTVSSNKKWISWGVILVLCALGYWIFIQGLFKDAVAAENRVARLQQSADGIDWVAFSPEELQKNLDAGKTVFLDFTAEWCLTCKLNERTAINTTEVKDFVKEKGIVMMKADWTTRDAAIGSLLKSYGRVGVPFYLVFAQGNSKGQPLPELLTKGILLDAFSKATEAD